MQTAGTKVKEASQIKPRIGQGRAGLRHKIKMPLNRPIMQVTEKPVEKTKALVLETSRVHDKVIPIPHFTIPHIKPRGDSDTQRVGRKNI